MEVNVVLKPQWWKYELPAMWGEKNPVLTVPELQKFADLLTQHKERIDKRQAEARKLMNAMTLPRIPHYNEPNRPLTLCDALECLVDDKKFELELMKLLESVGQRVEGTRPS